MATNQLNLESLFDLSAKLNSSEDKNFILNSALLSIMGKLGITRGAVFVKNSNNEFELLIKKGEIRIKLISGCDPSGLSEIDPSQYPQLKENGFKYSLCLSYRDRVSATILLGKKLTGSELSEFEVQYCRLVSTIASLALQNAEHYGELLNQKSKAEKKSQLLETLFQISRDFSLLLTREKIIQLTSYSLMGQLMVNKFAIILKTEDKLPDLIHNRFDTRFSFDILKTLLKQNQIDFSDNYSNEIFSNEDRNYLIKNNVKVISPMSIHGDVKGLLLIGPKMNGEEFTEDNLQFIEAIGNTAITALENERLVDEEIKKKQLESEMDLALEIQRGLFPKNSPTINGYDIFGLSLPSKQVGGDYFDHIKIDDDRYFVLVADVSGKGIPAAMIMANIQSALRLLVPMELSIEDIVLKINKIVFENTSADKFVTFFGGILDTKRSTLTYINAGHNPPYLLSDGKIDTLRSGGLLLGLMEEGVVYEKETIELKKGDSLVLFTDGIVEAQSLKDNEFGEEKLIQFIIENQNLSSKEFSEELVDEVKRFSYGAGQYDDITLITIKKD